MFAALQHLGHTNPDFATTALTYKIESLRIIQERFADPIQRCSSSTVYCVLALLASIKGLSIRVSDLLFINTFNILWI
jgi:hypothetical protein